LRSLSTPRNTLANRYVAVLMSCSSCLHRAEALSIATAPRLTNGTPPRPAHIDKGVEVSVTLMAQKSCARYGRRDS
jgi:hypothetical protein